MTIIGCESPHTNTTIVHCNTRHRLRITPTPIFLWLHNNSNLKRVTYKQYTFKMYLLLINPLIMLHFIIYIIRVFTISTNLIQLGPQTETDQPQPNWKGNYQMIYNLMIASTNPAMKATYCGTTTCTRVADDWDFKGPFHFTCVGLSTSSPSFIET